MPELTLGQAAPSCCPTQALGARRCGQAAALDPGRQPSGAAGSPPTTPDRVRSAPVPAPAPMPRPGPTSPASSPCSTPPAARWRRRWRCGWSNSRARSRRLGGESSGEGGGGRHHHSRPKRRRRRVQRPLLRGAPTSETTPAPAVPSDGHTSIELRGSLAACEQPFPEDPPARRICRDQCRPRACHVGNRTSCHLPERFFGADRVLGPD